MCEEMMEISKMNRLLEAVNDDDKILSMDDLVILEVLLKFQSHFSKSIVALINIQMIITKINPENADLVCRIVDSLLNCQESSSDLDFIKLRVKVQVLRFKLLNVIMEHQILSVDDFNDVFSSAVNDVDKESWNYMILHLIPKFMQQIGEELVLRIIWKKSLEMENLELVCHFAANFMKVGEILHYDEFWLLVQKYFDSNLASRKRLASFLFKVSTDALQSKNSFATENEIIKFDQIDKSSYLKSLDYLSILLEVSSEKQLHLLQPSIGMLHKINNLHASWLQLVYRIYLKHSQTSIVYRTLMLLLKSEWNFAMIYVDFLNALNTSEYSQPAKKTFQYLKEYLLDLSEDSFQALMLSSLCISWKPVSFWLFYNCAFETRKCNPYILSKVLQNSKQLPHKYIRKGAARLVCRKIKQTLKHTKIALQDLIELLAEFLDNLSLHSFAFEIIESPNLLINNNALEEMQLWLQEEFPNLTKVGLLVEIVNRNNAPISWIKKYIHEPFKDRSYVYPVLDKLSYIYCIKSSELEQYLQHRLDIIEDAHNVCLLDKISASLKKKCTDVLIIDESRTCQQVLAFEILFHTNENRYKQVYRHWIDRLLINPEVNSDLALGFISLLSKIPLYYIRNGTVDFKSITKIIATFYLTQPTIVLSKIFLNLDFIFERLQTDETNFVELTFRILLQTKKCECFEDLMRSLIRCIAVSMNLIKGPILESILRHLYELCKSSECAVYYVTMYFKFMSFDDDLLPVHEFLLFGDILSKTQSAEYEVCRLIYFNSYEPNPHFRQSEIHKWVLENIVHDVKDSRINRIAKALIAQYQVNFNKRYFPDSTIHLQKLRIMQAFAFIEPYIVSAIRDQLLALLAESFCTENHQPSVRQLMQYIFMQLLKNDANCLKYISSLIETASKTHTSTLTGFIPILYGLDLLKGDVEFSMALIDILLPWTMGAHFRLRSYAQLVICKICENNLSNDKFSSTYGTLVKAVSSVIKSTSKIELAILNDLHLIEYIHREKPCSNLNKLIYIITVYIPESTKVTHTEWEYFKIKNAWSKYCKDNIDDNQDECLFDETNMSENNIQKKMIPWSEFRIDYNMRGNLILVTSLIESAANLGGLSRTCEIFGVKQMAINNAKLLNDKEFQSLSMSSERWLDIIEVKYNNLREFLLKCKAMKYKLIGAEQTSDSCNLNEYKFDERTLILLGNERSGIPPELIPILDVCVEIPQLGMVRSLNVHVAGAMFVWEYAKQHMFK